MSDTSRPQTRVLSGGCRCGAIRYVLEGAPLTAATCHCRDCQYLSGGAPAHALIYAQDALRLLHGNPREYRYEGSSGHGVMRSFCGDRGTPLFGGSEGQGYVIVRAGSLDDPEHFRTQVSLWTASAPSWHSVDAEAPRHARNAPA